MGLLYRFHNRFSCEQRLQQVREDAAAPGSDVVVTTGRLLLLRLLLPPARRRRGSRTPKRLWFVDSVVVRRRHTISHSIGWCGH
jgi:hypothetical protein